MDAHLFRRFAQEVRPHLVGARIAKIQEPGKDIFTLSLDLFARASSLGRKGQLVLKCGRKDPFLFFSRERISANAQPSARVMRLRKYAQGRSIRHVVIRWIERELWLLMSGAMPDLPVQGSRKDGLTRTETIQNNTLFETASDTNTDFDTKLIDDSRELPDTAGQSARPADDKSLVWLVLRLREGPELVFAAQNEWPEESLPAWPETRDLACAMEDWRSWPVLTPSLRRALAKLDKEDAAALLVDLQEGGGDVFCAMQKAEDGKEHLTAIAAWPTLADDTGDSGMTECAREDILDACMEAGNELVLKEQARKQARQAADPWIRKEKKLLERLELHDEDVERLQKMCGKRSLGQLLQANLWQLPAKKRLPEVEVLNMEGATQLVRLDPRLTVQENMERFFHTARRGERGLDRVEERRQALVAELAEVQAQKEACLLGAPVQQTKRKEERAQNLDQLPSLPASVQLFISSDGFMLLRGRNARGNQDVRRIASPHDIWVHAEGGPGAHVVIRRSHAAETVPDRTLDEAGSLAACRSWLKEEPQARLSYCEIRHVRPLRGAAPGTMRMDKVLFTRTVPVDASMETRLLPQNRA